MVTGLDKMRAQLAEIPDLILPAIIKALEKSATEIVRDMRVLVPRKSGALANSIGWTWGAAPKGSITIGKVGNTQYSKISITIFVGGTESTARRQARSSGTRARDRHRSGYFDSDVARYQEFGTINMPAHPFFYPAYRANKARVKGRLSRAVTSAVKKSRTK